MPTDAEYRDRVQAFNWDDLRSLWKLIEERDTAPDWDKGKAFEYLIIRAFELDGAKVTYPFSVKLPFIGGETIEQIDGAIHLGHLSCIAESKDLEDPANIEPITKLRNQLTRRPNTTIGIIFSMNGFTNPALVLAHFTQPQTILLWNGEEVGHALENRKFASGLIAKYHHYVEHGLVEYNIIIEEIT